MLYNTVLASDTEDAAAAPRSSHSSTPAVGGMEDEDMDLQRTLVTSMDHELPTGGGGGGIVGAFGPTSEVEEDTSGVFFDGDDEPSSHEDHPTTSISDAGVATSNPEYGGVPVAHGALVRQLQEFLRDLADFRISIAGTARSSGGGSRLELMFFCPM